MKRLIVILAIVAIFGCEKQTTESFTITNQISNYCYHPKVHFADGSIYSVENNITSLGMTSEPITAKANKFKFMFTNRDNQTFINVDWVEISGNNVIIGSQMQIIVTGKQIGRAHV